MQVRQKRTRVYPALYPDDNIVGISHDDDVTLSPALPPLVCPKIEDIVKVHVCEKRRDNRTLRRPSAHRNEQPVFHHTSLEPLSNQSNYSPIADAVFEETDEPVMIHRIKERPEVSVDDEVHGRSRDRVRKRVERIVLPSAGTKSVREPEEIFLIDRVENFDHRALDDFVLQRRDAERSFTSIRLGDHPSPRWKCSIRSALNTAMQVEHV